MKKINRRQFAQAALSTAAVAAIPAGVLVSASVSKHTDTTVPMGWKSSASGNVFGKPGMGTLPG
ncbi:MAG: hypothetical protein WBO55_05405 [Rhizobiaceae bacterium]